MVHRAQTMAAPNTETVQSTKPLNLKQAVAQLENAIAAGENPSLEMLQRCCNANAEVPQRHALYFRLGKVCIQLEQWALAETLAILSLKAFPNYGAAFKLLGQSLAGIGQKDDAAICHRFGLPTSMLLKHFNDVPITSTTTKTANADDITKVVAFPGKKFPLNPPRQLRDLSFTEFTDTELHAVEARCVTVQQGRLWYDGFNIVVWDRHGNVVRDLCRGYAEVVQGSLGSRQPVPVQGRVCLLGNRNAVNYYHWMNDVLPRLEVLRAAGSGINDIDRFVCNPIEHEFQKQTLKQLDFDFDKLLGFADHRYIQADELVIPVYGSNSLGMRQGAWNPAFYKRLYLGNRTARERDLKLYISRGSEGARGVTNDADVVSCLTERGFTIVRAEQLSITEQADMFSRASVVIGPHGAGFSNIVFCQPGTKVIELFHAHIVQCFHVISELTDLEHYIHFCGTYDEESRPSDNETYHRTMHARRTSPFAVALQDIADILEFANAA